MRICRDIDHPPRGCTQALAEWSLTREAKMPWDSSSVARPAGERE
jgi:hypothetical protein